MSAIEILEFVKVAYCYPNVAIAHRNLLTMLVAVAPAKKKFFKVKIIEKLL
jgi:hypothetical protein